MPIEQVADSTTSYTQKCATSQAIEESAHEHSLDVLRHGAWNEPDEEQSKRADVDISTAVELVQG